MRKPGKHQALRHVYRTLTTENDTKTQKKGVTGNRNNLADEIIASMQHCDDHPMVVEVLENFHILVYAQKIRSKI